MCQGVSGSVAPLNHTGFPAGDTVYPPPGGSAMSAHDPMATDTATDASTAQLTIDGTDRDADVFYVVNYWLLPEEHLSIVAITADFDEAVETARNADADSAPGNVVKVADDAALADTFDSWTLSRQADDAE